MKFSLSWCICGKGVGDTFAHEYHWGCVEKDGAKEQHREGWPAATAPHAPPWVVDVVKIN